MMMKKLKLKRSLNLRKENQKLNLSYVKMIMNSLMKLKENPEKESEKQRLKKMKSIPQFLFNLTIF